MFACRAASTIPKTRLLRGFTLLELLMVIGIIALLIAITLPSLEGARVRAKNSVCLSNLRHIASASHVYAAEDRQEWGIPVHALQFHRQDNRASGGTAVGPSRQPDPNPPPADGGTRAYVGAYEWGGKSGVGRDYWLGPPGAVNSRYGTKAGFGPATRPLNAIVYAGGFADHGRPTLNRAGALQDTRLDLPFFRCPGDDGPPRGAHCPDWVRLSNQSSYDHFGNSYAANLFMIGGGLGGTDIWSNSPFLRPLSRVPNPARTLFYEENIGRWAWAARREICPSPATAPGIDPGPTKAIRGWHGADWTYNRSFVDAHAERQRIYIEGTEDEQGYAEHYRNEDLSNYPVTYMGEATSRTCWNTFG